MEKKRVTTPQLRKRKSDALRQSSQKRIIDALKNKRSDMHLLIGDETTTGGTINYAKIRDVYAPKHEKNRFF
jgi:hypothetical protein